MRKIRRLRILRLGVLQKSAIVWKKNDLKLSQRPPRGIFERLATLRGLCGFNIPLGIYEKDMNVCIASRAQLVATNMKVIFNLSSRIEKRTFKKAVRGRARWR